LERKYGLPVRVKKWTEFLEPVVNEINKNLPALSKAKTFNQNLVLSSLKPNFSQRIIAINNLGLPTAFVVGEKCNLLYTDIEKHKVGYKYTSKLGIEECLHCHLKYNTFLHFFCFFRSKHKFCL
jgi:hypothetical protein